MYKISAFLGRVLLMEVTIERYNPWKSSLIGGIFMLIVGILLVVMKQDGLRWILIIAGILLIVLGVLTLFDWTKNRLTIPLVFGALMIVIGILLVALPNVFEDILMIILAAGLILMGIITLLGAIGGSANTMGKVLGAVVGVILVILGVVALMNLDETADIVMIIIGALLAVAGLLQIVDAVQMRKA